MAICGENNDQFAIKIFNKDSQRRIKEVAKNQEGDGIRYKDAYENVMREIEIMEFLDHPNVTRIHEVIDDEDDENLFIVMDCCNKGQIIDWDEEKEAHLICLNMKYE